ncbi:hypothetical protein [Actinopolymorpha pittospori]|uniref:Uncharacterized protein n=1 Tax=Actinopolymorpha pittospori TaxID=648752 RepID=A0A927MPJ2_9ACTN|nr:hypothetical protein [Actinopolymorpha pittospori]MBE1603719.1 hypothetical protein [Actinopolymorpha pittospori]
MDSTVVVAAMGFASTLLGVWLAAYWQRRSNREIRILDAKVRVYGDCATAMYDYERATYNRVKTRLESPADPGREELRQEAYRCNARVRSAIGQAAILSSSDSLQAELDSVRQAVGDLNKVESIRDLKFGHERVYDVLAGALARARSDLKV